MHPVQGQPQGSDQHSTEAARSVSRRALLKVGWVVPVIMAVGIPRDAFAQYGPPTGPPT
jgi:hypothetical protein